MPLPAFFSNFFPPDSPFLRHHLKNFFVYFLSAPYSNIFRANKYIKGTGNILPIIAIIYEGNKGKPNATAYGMAPLSSIIGTIDTRNTIKYFLIIKITFLIVSKKIIKR